MGFTHTLNIDFDELLTIEKNPDGKSLEQLLDTDTVVYKLGGKYPKHITRTDSIWLAQIHLYHAYSIRYRKGVTPKTDFETFSLDHTSSRPANPKEYERSIWNYRFRSRLRLLP